MRGIIPKDLFNGKFKFNGTFNIRVDEELAKEWMTILMVYTDVDANQSKDVSGTVSDNKGNIFQYSATVYRSGSGFYGMFYMEYNDLYVDMEYTYSTSYLRVEYEGPYTFPETGEWGEWDITFNGFTDEEAASIHEWVTNGFNFIILYDNALYAWLNKCIKKLKKINTKLDYMLQLPSEVISPSVSFTSNISGISSSGNITARLIGNYLMLFDSLTLTSAAQTSVGTGSFTAKLVGTFTFSNFVLSSPSTSNSTNLQKIYSTTPTGSSYEVTTNTGYTSGNAQPAAFFWRTSISGTTLTVQLYVKAVKTATANWQLGALIPVLRVPPYTG